MKTNDTSLESAAGSKANRLTVLALADAALCAISLAGCSATAHASPSRPVASTASAKAVQATATAEPGDTGANAVTCAVVSAIQTTALNAHSGYTQGKLAAEQYAGAVNTIPEQYAALSFQPSYGLHDLVAAAKAAIGKTTSTVDGDGPKPEYSIVPNAKGSTRTRCGKTGSHF